MKKLLLLLCIGALSINLIGCSTKETIKISNNTVKMSDTQKKQDTLLNLNFNIDDKFNILLNYGGDNFMISDLEAEKVYIYDKDCNLIETIQGRYYGIAMSPDGKECLLIEDNHTKRTWYKKNIGKDFKKTLYLNIDKPTNFSGKEKALFCAYPLKWTKEGIYFMNLSKYGDDQIYLLKPDNSVEFICHANSEYENYIDVMNEWILSYQFAGYGIDGKRIFKTNIKTNERINALDFKKDVNGDTNIYIEGFFKSADNYIGYNYKEDKIFIFNNNEKQIVQEGILIGTIKNGFVYRVEDTDKIKIYVKK